MEHDGSHGTFASRGDPAHGGRLRRVRSVPPASRQPRPPHGLPRRGAGDHVPQFRHERAGRRLGLLVVAYAEAFDLACEAAGATTFHKGIPGRRKGQGKEPDESFYLGEAVAAVASRETLDLATDPPPSLWIEVDDRASSQARLPLHAALGVPEVWRYRPRSLRLWFGQLRGDGYDETAVSTALPGLTPRLVLDAMAGGAARDLPRWGRWLREDWFPAHRQELVDHGAGR